MPYPTSTFPDVSADPAPAPEAASEPAAADTDTGAGSEAPTATVSSGEPTGSSVPSSPYRAVTTPP